MHSKAVGDMNGAAAPSAGTEDKRHDKLGAGLLVSIALHLVAAVALVLSLMVGPSEAPLVIPVDVIRLADQATSPSETNEAEVPSQQAAPQAAPVAKPVTLSPAATTPPRDELDIKLHALAQLHEPTLDRNLSETGEGLTRLSTTRPDAVPGSQAAFKEFLRDQIEHHWGLDLDTVRRRDISIELRMTITGAGIVTSADVLNEREAGVDPILDDAARSARNAALLSSPLALPPGHYPERMQVILTVNTRDALR